VPGDPIRYRAESRYTYARALLELVLHARQGQDQFSFGPLDLGALERNGLAVSGPDLTSVQKVLAKIPGLVQEAGQ